MDHAPGIEAAPAMELPEADRELVAQLRAGHAEAFVQVMRRYNRRLFRAARGIVHDDAEAQDAVQEAYLRAFLALDSYRGEAALGTWLTRIVINQALGQQRKLGRHVFLDESPSLQEDSPMVARGPGRAATVDEETPEDAASRNELLRALEAAIDLLPAPYRCVFILRAVEDLSVQDTAASLGVSQEVVKTRYLRARGLLRRHLDAAATAPLHAVHDFRGPRCDELLRRVLDRLRQAGVVRDA